ncbi:MAG: Asp-tRNA(Asn)/Glu-tRNA(Gln) amidotransferase subunit GatB [Anaerolineales bacterium]
MNDSGTVYEAVVGLEVHAELLTRSKMFCGCAVVDSTIAEPNTSICEICTGMPGTLPVINQQAVAYALLVALALGCEIPERSVFARKNYFYPDLPKGYQISQYELPLARNGSLPIVLPDESRQIRIRRVHLEEDTGKLSHESGYSLVDYNRSGVPLLEIVSEPELTTIEEIKAYATALRSLLQYLGVNSGDMEKGVIRFEANVSVRPAGSQELNTRTEIKNLNSFRGMLRAVEYEISRQSALLESGEKVVQQTLGWDEGAGVTVPQRSKEEAHDYRYFPEPDLPPLVIDRSWIQQLEKSIPELPFEKQERYIQDLGLSRYLADVIAADRPVAEFYETALASQPDVDPQKLANWLTSDLFGLLNEAGQTIAACHVTPLALSELVLLVDEGAINATSGKTVLSELFQHGGLPDEIVQRLGLGILNDPAAIEALVEDVLASNPEQVDIYLQGKDAVAKWLFGQIMRSAAGRADPALLQQVLDKHLFRLRSAKRD